MDITEIPVDEIIKSFEPFKGRPPKKTTPCIIKINGVRMKTKSGKAVWPSKGAAKAAITHHLKCSSWAEYPDKPVSYAKKVYHFDWTDYTLELTGHFDYPAMTKHLIDSGVITLEDV